MTPAGQTSIALYFDEADGDLWQVLQLIEPEKRSALIKEALRLLLLSHNMGQKFLSPADSKNGEEPLEMLASQAVEQDGQTGKEPEPISLEALFTSGNVAEPAENELLLSKGYQHMLKNVFALEEWAEDETVLEVLRGRADEREK